MSLHGTIIATAIGTPCGPRAHDAADGTEEKHGGTAQDTASECGRQSGG
jgi:hypothetical protein